MGFREKYTIKLFLREFMKKNLLGLCGLVFAIASFSQAAHAEEKIASVNIMQVISQSEVGKAALAQLFKGLESEYARRDELFKATKALQAKREREKDTIKPSELKTLDQNIAEQAQEFEFLNRNLSQLEVNEVKSVLEKHKSVLAEVLEAIAKKEGYTVILYSEAVVYPTSRDVSSELLVEFNAKTK